MLVHPQTFGQQHAEVQPVVRNEQSIRVIHRGKVFAHPRHDFLQPLVVSRDAHLQADCGIGKIAGVGLELYATAQQRFPRLPRWLQSRQLREPNDLLPVEHPLTAVSRQEPFTQNGIKKFGVGEVIKDHSATLLAPG